MVGNVLGRNNALDTPVTVVDQGEEHLVQELLCNIGCGNCEGNIGDSWVMSVELRGNTTNASNEVGLRGGRNRTPPLISDLAASEGDEVAVRPVVVDLSNSSVSNDV